MRYALLVALIFPASSAGQQARPAGPGLGDGISTPAIAVLRLDSLARADLFSGTVLVARGDEILIRTGLGMADRERAIAMAPETMLNIGSITKAFTQVAILRLAQEGKLELDDPIAKYVDGFPADVANAVTIRQLLRHHGGMGDFFSSPMFRQDPAAVRTLEDYLRIARATPLEFPPGTRNRYSNLGYVTLGAVIERASGLAWDEAIARYVYGPAGMTASGVRERTASGIATGYAGTAPALEPNLATLPGLGSPAGGTYSTVDDLRRFALALGGGVLLDSVGTRLWFNGFEAGKSGWGPIAIAGGAPGVNAELLFNPVTREVVVVMSNRSPPSAVRIAEVLAAVLRGWPSPAPTP